MKRRHFLAGSAALTLAAPSVRAAGNPKLLKFIPQADIALLDPDFTPALVTRNHAYMVYDTLYGVDDALHPRPQMAAGIPGSLAVYLRNADYVPRTDGPPSGTAGPKIANFDRVEWHTIPDPATAAAAIQAGEADWWEQATSDLLPLLRSDKNVRVEVIDSLGYHAVLRFNHLYPPFDNAGIRRALLGAFSQTDMMTAVAGDDRSMWKAGVGFFQPNSPCASDAGMEKLNSPRDLAQVKRDLAAAGYNGEKFVFLVPTDLPAINAMSEVAADIFRKLGMNMDYQTLDWATVAQRLNSQEPLDKGGWSSECKLCPRLRRQQPRRPRLPARPRPQIAVRMAHHAEAGSTPQRLDRFNRSGRTEAPVPGDPASGLPGRALHPPGRVLLRLGLSQRSNRHAEGQRTDVHQPAPDINTAS